MQTPLRAGLSMLILSILITFASTAPLHIMPEEVSLPTRPAPVSSKSIPALPSYAMLHDQPRTQRYLGSAIEGVASMEFEVLVRRVSIKERFKRFGQKVRAGFHKFAEKAKAGFKKVGHFFKETGAKIAKFGLKVVATVTKLAAKIVGFIPGVGKIAGKALEGVSEATNIASDKIHAKLPGKLEHAMAKMDKVRKVAGYIP